MNDNRRKDLPDGAVPVDVFLKDASLGQLQAFRQKCQTDPNFDWMLTVDGIPIPAGTAWAACCRKTGHKVRPHVFMVDGEPKYIGVYVKSGGRSVAVVPLLRRDCILKVGVVYQLRPFASTDSHPSCHIIAGVPRGTVEDDETLDAGARREVMEELGGYRIVGDLLPLPTFKADANYIESGCSAFVAWIDENSEAGVPDADECIVLVHWLTVSELLQRFRQGVTVEEFEGAERREVNWAGAIEWFPLMLALSSIPELQSAFIEAIQAR